MPERYRVVLQGFSAAEQQRLASCFDLAPQREPAYVQVRELWESDYIVADAADSAIVTLIMQAGRLGDTVFVGPRPVPGALGHVARPYDAVAVVRALDALAALRGTGAVADEPAGPAPAPQPFPAGVVAADEAAPSPPAPVSPIAPVRPAKPAKPIKPIKPTGPPLDPKAAKARARAAAQRRRNAASPTTTDPTPLEALVLDDSPVATDYLRHHLEGLGLHVHTAATSAEALEMLTHQPIAVAFLDIVLGDDDEFDGLDICQRLKHEPIALAGGAPIVVLVSGQGKASDRVRATLAGADAYLTKPFSQQDVVRALESCGLTPVPMLSAPLPDTPPG
jgi:CheY-like chemotaxis protein